MRDYVIVLSAQVLPVWLVMDVLATIWRTIKDKQGL